MIRFLRVGSLSVKKLRIAFSLLRMSFNAIFFDHHHYFGYCFLLTIVQFSALLITGIIHSRLRLSLLVSESLAGLNFFEILFESVDTINWVQLLFLASVLCIQLFLMYLVYSAVSCYTKAQADGKPKTIIQSFGVAVKKSSLLASYAVLETIILFLCALLGIVGNIIYFGWQLLTIFNIQFITFESVNAISALQRSTQYFFKNAAQALSMDAFIELILIVLMSGVYYFSQQPLLEPIKSISENYGIAFGLLYLLSVLYVLENITFTLLYRDIKNRS